MSMRAPFAWRPAPPDVDELAVPVTPLGVVPDDEDVAPGEVEPLHHAAVCGLGAWAPWCLPGAPCWEPACPDRTAPRGAPSPRRGPGGDHPHQGFHPALARGNPGSRSPGRPSGSRVTESLGRTVAMFRIPRLWVKDVASSTRCHRFMGAPVSTRRWGRQFRGSTWLFSRMRPARVRASQIPMRTSPQAASRPAPLQPEEDGQHHHGAAITVAAGVDEKHHQGASCGSQEGEGPVDLEQEAGRTGSAGASPPPPRCSAPRRW